jgi:hypothetical protein
MKNEPRIGSPLIHRNFRFSPHEDVCERLLPWLDKRVFHVSLRTNLEAILADGEIRANMDSSYRSTFGSSRNSFIRNRGLISLFDYRSATRDQIALAWDGCAPVQPAYQGKTVVFFFLSPAHLQNVISNDECGGQDAGREMMVPYVEAGHKGPISMKAIEEIMLAELAENDEGR